MRHDSRGIKLSEILVVIAALGMLAAFAVPRFIYKQSDAHAAAVQTLAGRVRTSAFLAHEVAAAQGATGSVFIQGRTIAIEGGYPTLQGIDAAVAPVAGFTFKPGLWTRDEARSPLGCSVRYVPAVRSGAVPQVDIDTRGC